MGLLKGGVIIALGRIIGVIVSIALNIVLARTLTKVDFGLYVLFFNLATFLGVLVVFGSQNVALRLFSDLTEGVTLYGANKLLRRFVGLLFISSAVVLVLTVLFYNSSLRERIALPDSNLLMILLFLNGVGLGLQALFVEIFRAFKSFFSVVVFSGAAPNVITIIAVFTISFFDWVSVEAALLAVVVSIFLAHAFSVVVLRRLLVGADSIGAIDEAPTLQCIFNLSVPSFFNKLGLFLTLMSDVWLLAWFATQEFIADYGAAARLAAAISFFAGISNGVVPPFVSKFMAAKDYIGLQRLCRSVTTLVSYPSVALLIFIVLFGERILESLYGYGYASAYDVLVILSVAHVSNALTGCCGYVLVMNGHNALLMKISIFTGLFSILSSLVVVAWLDYPMAIVYCFAAGIVLRQLLAWVTCMKYCGVNTVTHLNPAHMFKLLQLKRST